MPVMRGLALLCTMLPAMTPAVFAESCDDTQPAMATEFGRFVPWQRPLKPGEPRQLKNDEELRYLRIQLKSLAPPGVPWSLTIRDKDRRPLQTLSSRAMPANASTWSDRFSVSEITLEVTAAAAGAPVLETLRYAAVPKNVKRPYYSRQDPSAKPNWQDLYCCNTPEFRRDLGESVGMLVATEGNVIDGVALWTCSGFVIANEPDILFVTNHHCGGTVGVVSDRWSAAVCNNAFVDFSWDGDGIGREYKCHGIAAEAPEDDLVVLQLKSTRDEAPPPALPIRSKRASQIAVWMIHHPAAETKKISRDDCQALTTSVATVDANRDFAHRCDTEAGSSGAPMLDQNDAVVGVHHTGFEKIGASCDKLNKAVHANQLLKLLAAKPELKGYRILP